jgi:hypothetical protein
VSWFDRALPRGSDLNLGSVRNVRLVTPRPARADRVPSERRTALLPPDDIHILGPMKMSRERKAIIDRAKREVRAKRRG